MSEEADADWQDGLVEWGEEDSRKWLTEKMDAALMKAAFGPPRKQRQTALRVYGRSFETVELDDAGKVIEPVRCICGHTALIHQSKCPFANYVF